MKLITIGIENVTINVQNVFSIGRNTRSCSFKHISVNFLRHVWCNVIDFSSNKRKNL